MKSKFAAAGIAAVAAAAPAAAPAAALAASSTVDWQIQMHESAAYAKANGSAQYQSQPGQRELQVEVQRVRSLAGKTVVFSAAGMTLGSAKVSASGRADITRNTELGQKVPLIFRGSSGRSPDGRRQDRHLRAVLVLHCHAAATQTPTP